MSLNAETSVKYSSSAMRSEASARSSSVMGAWMVRYAHAREARRYFATSSCGMTEGGETSRSAACTAVRTARCVRGAFNG